VARSWSLTSRVKQIFSLTSNYLFFHSQLLYSLIVIKLYLAGKTIQQKLKSMRAPEFIKHKGETIYFMDFEGLKTLEDFKGLIDASKKHIRNQPPKSVVALTSMEGMHFSKEIRDMISDFIGGNKPYMKVSAVYGISGLLRVVYNGVTRLTGRDVRAFESREKALEWLTSKQTADV